MARTPGMLLVYQRRFCPEPLDQLVRQLSGVELARDGQDWRVTMDGAELWLSLQVGAPVARAVALLEQTSSIDRAILARCDAVIVASWDPAADVTELSLEATYLEETLRGVTVFLHARTVSAGSFPAGAGQAVPGDTLGDPLGDPLDKPAPPPGSAARPEPVPAIDTAALTARLLGSWRLDPAEPCTVATPGELAMTVTRAGELVYSDRARGGLQRIQLTYRVDGADLVTDQPSAPREQRSPLVFGADGRLYSHDLGAPAVFVRETAADILDPDAALSALAGFALRHGIASAGAGEPLIPFVVSEDGAGQRSLTRYVTDAVGARAAGEAALRDSAATMYAFALDGYVTLDGKKTDAVIVEAGRRGRDRALVFVQPYAVRGDTAVATGPQHASGDAPSWLGANAGASHDQVR